MNQLGKLAEQLGHLGDSLEVSKDDGRLFWTVFPVDGGSAPTEAAEEIMLGGAEAALELNPRADWVAMHDLQGSIIVMIQDRNGEVDPVDGGECDDWDTLDDEAFGDVLSTNMDRFRRWHHSNVIRKG